ncbi:beta subunit of fatty acid synthetase, partial [Coemansia biformis]
RVILTNVLRLLGAIKAAKERTRRATRPSLVVLPLSPNHGTIGGDGLYGECKIALETVLNRWASEGWEGHLSVAGAVIGWTRGTGLVSGISLVAQEVEALGVRTFSTREMAFTILGLLHPRLAKTAHHGPVWADFGGGMERVRDLSGTLKRIREAIDFKSSVRRLIAGEDAFTNDAIRPRNAAGKALLTSMTPLAKHQHSFPAARDYDGLAHLHDLQGMVNLDKVVVVTGYGEVSPHGNAETRWEVEAYGELSVEGCIELAWIMGLIRHVNGPLPGTTKHYTGWVDAKSGDPVRDADIKPRYDEYIRTHTGIRLIEPELALGYDPAKKQVLREVQIEHDMEPFEATAEDAAAYKKSNGDRVDVWENAGGASWSVRFLK